MVKVDMSEFINPEMLTYADEDRIDLTVDCQESLNTMFISHAYKLAKEEINAHGMHQRVCTHYYNSLAHFMTENPQILIELVLLKPDFSKYNLQ